MKNISLVFVVLLLLSSARVFAQGCEESSSEEGVRVFGFLQSQYQYKMTDDPTNTFNFKRARIGVTGNIPYDFSYYMVLEASPFINGENPYLLDAFVSYRRWKWFKMSLGAFKTPFSQELLTACSGLHTVYRSTVVDQVIAPQRDLGFMIMGGNDTTLLRYSVGIMNGYGVRTDNNTKKDIVARVVLQPAEWLSIGANYRKGYPTNDEDTRTTYGADIELNMGNLFVQGEYIYDEGDYNRGAGGGCGSEPMILGEEREGAYLMAGYMTQWNIQPVVKYDFFDTGNSNIRQDAMTFGVNAFFNDWTRLQVNYVYRAEDPVEAKNDEVVVQLQVKF
jgi:phosphate-selective porin